MTTTLFLFVVVVVVVVVSALDVNDCNDERVVAEHDDWPWFDARSVGSAAQRLAMRDCELIDCSVGARSQRPVAVISTTVDDLYFFFTPLTSLIWSALMGYDVACVLVGPDPRSSTLLMTVLNATLRVGVDVFWIASSSEPDVADATTSQLARLFVPMLYADERYVLTSDNDMWVLDRQHFRQRSGDDDDAHVDLFYGNAYRGRVPPMYPICYIGMRVSLWLEILRVARSRDLAGATHRSIRRGVARYGGEWNLANKAVSPQWYYDQIVFGEAIAAWRGHPSQCRIIERNPGRDRLDRGRWQFRDARDLAGKIDAHLLRPGWTDANWPRLQTLWRALFSRSSSSSAAHVAFAEQFVIDFRRVQSAYS